MKLFYMLYNCLTTTRIYTSIYFQLMLLFCFSHTAFHALWLSHSHLLWYPAYFFFNYILYISLYFISFHEIYLLFSGNIHNWCISLSFSIKCIYIHIYIYLFFSRSHLLLHTHQYSVYFPYSVSFPFIQLHISVFLLCTAHKVAPHHFYTWALPHLPIFPSRSTAIPISFPLMLSYVVERIFRLCFTNGNDSSHSTCLLAYLLASFVGPHYQDRVTLFGRRKKLLSLGEHVLVPSPHPSFPAACQLPKRVPGYRCRFFVVWFSVY